MEAAAPIPCYGVSCDLHSECACYAAVEFSDPRALRIGFCPRDARGEHTLFVPKFPVPVVCLPAERRAAA
jgi:hypothetical protein